MDVSIYAVGRLKAGPERELCETYLDRARKTGAGLGFRGFAVREIAPSTASRAADRIKAEEAALLSAVGADARIVCFDEAGEIVDSPAFADLLRRSAELGTSRLVLLIGGLDGLGRDILGRSDRCISLGRMTWPHLLARVLVAEQLYRAMTILSGHPYHRA